MLAACSNRSIKSAGTEAFTLERFGFGFVGWARTNRRVSRGSHVHGFTQRGYLVEQAGEIIALDTQHLGRPGRRYGRRTQFARAEHRFADHLARPHHGNAVLADVHSYLPAEQDVAGV